MIVAIVSKNDYIATKKCEFKSRLKWDRNKTMEFVTYLVDSIVPVRNGRMIIDAAE